LATKSIPYAPARLAVVGGPAAADRGVCNGWQEIRIEQVATEIVEQPLAFLGFEIVFEQPANH
jgi:hypothetical protein